MSDTLVGAVADLAAKNPDATAVLEKRYGKWVERSIGDLVADASRLAGGLASLGVGSGDAVALIASARLEWIALDLAVQATGAATLALPSKIGTEDAARVLADADIHTVVVEAQDQADVVLSAVEAGRLPGIRTIVYIDAAGVSEYTSSLLRGIDDLRSEGDLALGGTGLTPDTPGAIAPTGAGYDGLVPVSQASLLEAARSTIQAFSLGAKDRVIAARDIADPVERGATLYAALLSGATLGIPENAATVDAAIHEIAPTYVHVTERWLARHAASVTVRFDENRGLKAWLAGAWRRRTGSTLERYGSARPAGGLWRFMVTLPILEELGLEKARAVVVSGGPTPRDLVGFYAALGLPIRTALAVPGIAGFVAVGEPGDADGWIGSNAPGVDLSLEGGRLRATTPAAGTVDCGVSASASNGGFVAGVGTPEEAASARLRSIPVIASAIITEGASAVTVELDGAIASRWATRNSLDAATYRSFSTLPEMREGVEEAVSGVLERFGLTAGSVQVLPTPLHDVPGALGFGDVPRRDIVASIA
jgi:long-chain acyl-CoA synthetase